MWKIRPPITFLICLGGIGLSHWLAPGITLWAVPFTLVFLPLLMVGLALTWMGSRYFAKIGTNIDTFGKPDTLVTEGLFQYSRNPMYLGFILILAGVAGFLGSAWPWFWVITFLLLLRFWYIPYEEKAMMAQFGDAYRRYQKMTGRWLTL